jgi:hypothetical protein
MEEEGKMHIATSLPRMAVAHWFLLLLPAILLVEFAFARTTDWAHPGRAEAVILFDLCLFAPALYIICYRRRFGPGALVLRTAGLILLGIYIAGMLVPPEGQNLLTKLSWLRPLGLAVLALIEIRLFAEMVRMAFSGGASAPEMAARSGTPVWVARLMLLEAGFWTWVWRMVRGR